MAALSPPPNKTIKRLAFFTFHEKDGIARSYIYRYLRGLQEIADKIVFIVNGNLSENSHIKITQLGNSIEILVRENKGLDFGAWKHAIDSLGWENIESYDELILCNCSCYGPLFPFSEVFQKMDREHPNSDFWGLTNHLENKTVTLVPNNPNSYIREHIQSYFIVLKNTILRSQCFHDYWENLISTSNFYEEVYEHENKFTEYFSQNGYQWAVAYPAISNEWDSIHYCCVENAHNRIPLIKRKIFSRLPLEWEAFTEREKPSQLVCYLNSIGYPVDEIYEDLLATKPLSCICQNLQWNRAIIGEIFPDANIKHTRIALIFFSFYPDLVNQYIRYLKDFPEYIDIYVILSSSQSLKRYQDVLRELPNHIEYRIKSENKGRDFAAYIIECKDIFDRYDIVCCSKDKYSPQNGRYVANSWDRHCWNNIAYSKQYIIGLINLFLKNPKLGLIIPPIPDFGPFVTLGAECNINENNFKNLWDSLKIHIPFEECKIAPFGSMFWIRSEATKTLRSKDWNYSDMPEEPLAVDGTLLHALERIWAYAAQNDGFYTLTCFPYELANLYYGLSTQHLRELREACFKRFSVHNHLDLIRLLDQPVSHRKVHWHSLWCAVKYYLRGKYAWTHLRRVYYREKLNHLLGSL